MEIKDRVLAQIFDKDNLSDYQLDEASTSIEDINIFDDLMFDSIQFIELIVRIEAEFNIEIDDELLLVENFSTIGKIIRLVSNHLNR